MCFSAGASFLTSGGLAAAGAAAMVVAPKKQRMIAVIPLAFAVQQAFEGIQWLALYRDSSSLVAAYGFLFFAFIFWPIYIPASIFKIDPKHRHILKWFVLLGVISALLYAGGLMGTTLVVRRVQQCIEYDFLSPLPLLAQTLYLIAVFGPLLVSSDRFLRWVGVTVAILAVIAWVFYTFAFASVWCFFAAAASVFIAWHIYRERRKV